MKLVIYSNQIIIVTWSSAENHQFSAFPNSIAALDFTLTSCGIFITSSDAYKTVHLYQHWSTVRVRPQKLLDKKLSWSWVKFRLILLVFICLSSNILNWFSGGLVGQEVAGQNTQTLNTRYWANIRARYNSCRYLPLGNDSDAMRSNVLRRAESNPVAVSWGVRWRSWFAHSFLFALVYGFRVLHSRWSRVSSWRDYTRNCFFNSWLWF